MHVIRSIGRNSFAATFDTGYAADAIVEVLVDELVKEVDGVPYYGYTRGEVLPRFDEATGNILGNFYYLFGKDLQGDAKRVAIEVHDNQWVSLGIGEIPLGTSNRMLKAAHVPYSPDYYYHLYYMSFSSIKTRLTVYVFASENWLVLVPRLHDAADTTTHLGANAAGGLGVFDLALPDVALDGSIRYSFAQLALLDGFLYRYWWPSAASMYQVILPFSFDKNEIITEENTNFLNSRWYSPGTQTDGVNGTHNYLYFPAEYPLKGQASEIRARVIKQNTTDESQLPRRMCGIKMLQPDGPFNLLDQISLKCDEKGFLDSINGISRPHLVIVGSHPTFYSTKFYYAIPS